MTVKNLDKLLEPHIDQNKKIIGTEVTNLVAPGENFGGEVFKIDITLQDSDTKKEEVLHLVGKVIPKDEKSQQIFNVQKTFKSETAFYERVVPALQNFHNEYNIKGQIDLFPKYYGSRSNLDGSENVDRDGVILLENLKIKGYNNIDRYIGYNLEEAKSLLRDLATFQSTVIALKIQKPDIFQSEVRQFCKDSLNEDVDDLDNIIFVIEEILRESDECIPLIPKVREAWEKSEKKTEVREPFATICHHDLWVNNIMTKYESNKETKNKFLDFQFYDYNSPVSDVLNFIFTSVQTDAAKENFDNLLQYYHTEFVSNLKQYGCDAEPFNYTEFEKELKLESEVSMVRAIGFVPLIIFGKKGETLFDDPNIDFKDPEVMQKILEGLMPEAKEKLKFIVLECHRKKWI